MIQLRHLAPAVAAAIRTQSGKPVGVGRIPGKESTLPDTSFAIVHHLASGHDHDTAMGFPHDMTWETVQVTSCGRTAEQAAWMADQSREAVLGKTGPSWTQAIDPDGCEVCGRRWDTSVGVSLIEGVWQAVERYRFLIVG